MQKEMFCLYHIQIHNVLTHHNTCTCTCTFRMCSVKYCFLHSDTVGVTTVGSGEGVEGEDDDIDFGYWEKAELPVHESALPVSTQSTTTSLPDTGSKESTTKDTAPRTSPPKDIDLSLL